VPNITDERLRRFFTSGRRTFSGIRREVARTSSFFRAAQRAERTRPRSRRLDLISCRNLLIYSQISDLQQ
jgi:chemotaxis methyl-accepting protein methylase